MLIKNWKFSSPWEQGKLNFKSVEVRWNICISSFQGRQEGENKAFIVSSLKVHKLQQNVHIKGDQRPLEESQTSSNWEHSQLETERWSVGVGRCTDRKFNTGKRKILRNVYLSPPLDYKFSMATFCSQDPVQLLMDSRCSINVGLKWTELIKLFSWQEFIGMCKAPRLSQKPYPSQTNPEPLEC